MIVSIPGPSSRAGPSQPQHLTITVLSSSSLTAEWVEATEDEGDPVITYTITLQGGPGATTRTLSSLRKTFTGLEAPNTYTVTVAAVNCTGLSPPATSTISFQGSSVHDHEFRSLAGDRLKQNSGLCVHPPVGQQAEYRSFVLTIACACFSI